MSVIVRDATNAPRTVTGIVVRDASNASRTITEIRVRDTTNTSRIVYSTASPMSCSVTEEYVYGITIGGGTVVTDSTTASASGGTGPYTYAWTVVSYNNAASPTVNSASAATTAFTQTGVGVGESYIAEFLVTATDSTPGTPLTATATVMASFTDAS